MLTDIFARRYQNILIWKDFDEAARRLLVQGFRIVSEQLFPYFKNEKVEHGAPELWDGLNKKLAMELGLEDLSPPVSSYPVTMQDNTIYSTYTYPKVTVCKNFVCAEYDRSVPADQFVKERLSFIEIAFRQKGEQITLLNSNLEQRITETKQQPHQIKVLGVRGGVAMSGEERRRASDEREQRIRNSNTEANQAFRAACDELNTRFRQARVNLDYHNGFIQISPDNTVLDQIEHPFWDLVSAPKWENVDQDMKEAIDLRDSSRRDPAGYAAKALESTVKVISKEKGWTHGTERGPQSYLDNLKAKKNGEFINCWEYEGLKGFFSNVRNPFAHGAGSDQAPKLTPQQTDWAIEFCMIWIKNLIRRM